MGRRGPRPTPGDVMKAKGDPGGHARDRGEEPAAPKGAPGMPTWLSREAKGEWRRIVPRLEAMGVLSTIDRAAIATYCEAWSDFVKWTAWLKKKGHTYSGPNGASCARPEVGYRDKARQEMRHLLAEFGLSPASRAGLVRKPVKPARQPARQGQRGRQEAGQGGKKPGNVTALFSG